MRASPGFSRGTAGYWRRLRRATVTAVPAEGSLARPTDASRGTGMGRGFKKRFILFQRGFRSPCEDRMLRKLGYEAGLITKRGLHFFSRSFSSAIHFF